MDASKRVVARRMTDRIVARAHELGLSQTDIANSLGTHRSTVNGWYRGAIPSPDHMVGLRKILRCSQDFLEGTTNIPGAKTESELLMLLDRTWELNDDVISTNAVLIPKYDRPGVAHATVFPTRFIDHVKDPAGLAYLVIQDKLVVFDSKEKNVNSVRCDYVFNISDIEATMGEAYLGLNGHVKAIIHNEHADLKEHNNITILGRVVFVGSRA